MDIARPDLARKKRLRHSLYSVSAIVVIALITVGVSRLEPAAPRVDRDTIYLDTVQRGPMVRQVRGTGTLVPEQIRLIPVTTDGTVERIVIRPGALVAPDTVILELSNPELEQSAQEVRLNLEAAEARYNNRQVEVGARAAEPAGDACHHGSATQDGPPAGGRRRAADGRRALRRPAGVRAGGERGQPVQGRGGRDARVPNEGEPGARLGEHGRGAGRATAGRPGGPFEHFDLGPVRPGAHRIGPLYSVEERGAITRERRDVEMSEASALIQLHNVSKIFFTDEVETHALDGIDLSIHPGEYVAISGPSGCGKSTLLLILGLLDSPTAGDYTLNGWPVVQLGQADRARTRNREIGFIFQSFNLIGDLTVYENVELPLTYRGMKRTERRERVDETLEKVEMAHRARHLPSQLSGGQQ